MGSLPAGVSTIPYERRSFGRTSRVTWPRRVEGPTQSDTVVSGAASARASSVGVQPGVLSTWL